MIKAAIFDWGRTIYYKENETPFPDTISTMEYFSDKYPLAIVSLAIDGDIEERFSKIDNYGLRKFINFALFHISDKDSLFRNAFGNLNVDPKEILVVDDRMKRLKFPIEQGCVTAWLQKGKFEHELPSGETGKPTHIIKNPSDLQDLFL